jgi:hypothetical protein
MLHGELVAVVELPTEILVVSDNDVEAAGSSDIDVCVVCDDYAVSFDTVLSELFDRPSPLLEANFGEIVSLMRWRDEPQSGHGIRT